MQSTAALKEYIDTAIKDVLYQEENQIVALQDRVDAAEELLGVAFAGFSRMATILNYIRNSGGSARINILELCEMLEAELRESVIAPTQTTYLNGVEVPHRVQTLIQAYRSSITPSTSIPEENFVDEEFVAVSDVLRDE